jgi:hypothetical protein
MHMCPFPLLAKRDAHTTRASLVVPKILKSQTHLQQGFLGGCKCGWAFARYGHQVGLYALLYYYCHYHSMHCYSTWSLVSTTKILILEATGRWKHAPGFTVEAGLVFEIPILQLASSSFNNWISFCAKLLRREARVMQFVLSPLRIGFCLCKCPATCVC